MLGIVILQTCILVVVFSLSNTKEQLVENSIHMLKDSVETKADEILRQMVSWSGISSFQNSIALKIEEIEKKEQKAGTDALKDKTVRKKFLTDISDTITDMLRSSETNGSFIILEGNGLEEKDSIYLRDMNPKDKSDSNKDILVLSGSSSLMLEKGYTLDSGWSLKLPVSADKEFYYKPYNAAEYYTDIDASNLGYWCKPFRLRENDLEIITYTQPLLDSNHNCIGVIGIEIQADYFNTFLSYNTMSIGERNSYYLGITQNSDDYSNVLVSDNYYKAKMPSNETMKPLKSTDKYQLCKVKLAGGNAYHIFTGQAIKLYNSNTPFEKEEWVVGGLVLESSLYEASNRFELALIIACSTSSIIAVLGAAGVTTSMVKPIKGLMKNIDTMKPYHVRLLKTNIREFDDLTKKIEDLSDKIYKSASKVADILEISNLPLGICEYDKVMNDVFCTHQFLEIMDIELENWNNNYVSKEDFEPIIYLLKNKLIKEKEEEDIYHFISPKGKEKWMNLKVIQTNKNSELVIMLDVTYDIEEKKRICHDRDYDVLTNLFNRRAFTDMVSDLIEHKKCDSGVLSIWDLDNLKFINDTYGHDMGDKYICLLAEVMKENTLERIICSRISGDEFMIFIYNYDLDFMYRQLEKIHTIFLQQVLFLPDGTMLPVSVSAGMVTIEEGNTYNELSKLADFAMYEIKKNEKGGIKRFDKESHLRDYILVQGVGELNRILNEKSVRYAFQPIVDLHERKVFGYEALMRPQSEMLKNPVDLLRVAESQSKLYQLEVLTWFQALGAFRQQKGNQKNKKLFINSIPSQVLSFEKLELLYETFSDLFSCVVMEITENTVTNTKGDQIKRKYRKKWNIQCALDDYGSGYSNTDLLVSGIYDYIKLDRTLICGIQNYPEQKELVSGIIQYCHNRKIKVIAEGIETIEELEEVIKLGADYGQGYLLGRPDFNLQEPKYEYKIPTK